MLHSFQETKCKFFLFSQLSQLEFNQQQKITQYRYAKSTNEG